MEACKSHFFHLKQCHPEQNIRTLRYIGYKNYYLPDPIRFYPVKAQNSWTHTLPRNVSCCPVVATGRRLCRVPPRKPFHTHTLQQAGDVFYFYFIIIISTYWARVRMCTLTTQSQSTLCPILRGHSTWIVSVCWIQVCLNMIHKLLRFNISNYSCRKDRRQSYAVPYSIVNYTYAYRFVVANSDTSYFL